MGLIADAVTRRTIGTGGRTYPWFYHLTYEEYHAHQRNATNERIAYKHIDANLRYKPAMSAHRWHETLAFLGLDD